MDCRVRRLGRGRENAADHRSALEGHGEWAVWGRRPVATNVYELVLHNIATGEQRVLDDESDHIDLLRARVWGDRVIWTEAGGLLREQIISTGQTRIVVDDMSLDPMNSPFLWEHLAVFTRERPGMSANVYLVNLETDEVTRISSSATNQAQSKIHDGRVVWTELGGGYSVRIFSIASGLEYVLTPSAVGRGLGSSEPLIWGQTLIWQGQPTPDVPGGIWVTRIGDI
jgi:hypothetical protein